MHLNIVSDTAPDAIQITHSGGELLEFSTERECEMHVHKNSQLLAQFALEKFEPGTKVKGFVCMLQHLKV